MKIFLSVIFFLISARNFAQHVWHDTVRTTVDLRRFEPGKKLVKAQYGKVILYFNQADYLNKEVESDTIRITPKYMDKHAVVTLLKAGRVKIIRRADSTVQTQIVHYLKRYGSMGDRIFEFGDGVIFLMQMEIIGLLDDDSWFRHVPKKTRRKPKPVVPVKDYAYKEDFPDLKDTVHITIKDYLPAKPGAFYVYNDNEGYGELDTNVCKSGRLNDKDIFYFAECYDRYDIISTSTTMIGQGIYFYRHDSLFTVEADYEKDIPEADLSNAVLMLPASMRPGDSSVVHADFDKKTIYTYLKKEDLPIGNIVHNDCIKIMIKECWPETIYLGYAWFKKDFGLIIYMRPTGRVEELVGNY